MTGAVTSARNSGGNRNYSDRTLKLLWGLSAGRCNRPTCRVELIAEATGHDRALVLGKIAHIVAHSDSGPRCDPTVFPAARNEYPNLLLLCPTCHDLVDGQSNTFTIQELQEWKGQHERWVREKLARELPSVGFAELEVLSRAILNAPNAPVIQFTVTDPNLKMQKNGLTQQVRHLLTMGLAKAKEVENFVAQMADIDAEFPERLKAGFVARYTAFRAEGLEGDGLFEAMVQFAAGGNRDLKRTATGLAVLAHLFEKCEVFEP